MGQALYRKYRSKKLSEIVGQPHITRTLENALKSGAISHAYLFTGPRGTGKTSIARILAHEINQLPYTNEAMHLDIIEIDAASNRRIDEIRDLRDKVHIAPTSAKYKVYIIDEVHMLTREAFNALLKTLEEPPAHVIFILATTEIHKLPETIISRTQRFTFKPIDKGNIIKHLKEIARSENIQIDNDALELLAEQGKGSFRDSISLLDQVGTHTSVISRADVEKLVGIAAHEHIDNLEETILAGTPALIMDALENLIADGIGPAQIAKQLSARLRNRLINGESNEIITTLLQDLLQVSSSIEPVAQLEIALFRAHLAANPSPDITQSVYLDPEPSSESAVDPGKKPAPKILKVKKVIEPPKSGKTGEPVEWWEDTLKHIKSINNTLYGVLRMAVPSVHGDTLELRFGFPFHQRKASDTLTQAKIQDAIKAVTGRSFKIHAVYEPGLASEKPTQTKNKKPEPKQEESHLDSVKNIFGGGEVLDS